MRSGLVALAGVVLASSVLTTASARADDGGTGCTSVARAATGPVVVAVVDSGVSDVAGLGAVVDPRSRQLLDHGGSGPVGGDHSGHGTAMAAIVHRSAPSARLLVLGALDDDARGDSSAIARAVDLAVGEGAEVINLSVDGIASDPTVAGSIAAAATSGTTVVVAAGNEGRDLDGHPGWERLAAIDGVVIVAAGDADGRITARSDWGQATVDLAAPGLEVPTVGTDGRPASVSGSSPAAAAVSGAIAAALISATSSGDCSAVSSVLARAVPTAGPDRTRHGWLAPQP